MHRDQQIISVFGSHAPQPGSQDYDSARRLGKILAQNGFAIATGGYGGVMAGASQGAAEAGGHVIGVTSRQVEASRPARLNQWVSEEIQYETLIERLTHLVRRNGGMIVCPGGIGTLSELALAWSLMQVNDIPRRPLVVLGEMWTDLLAVFSRTHYVTAEHRSLIDYARTPEDALEIILGFK